MAKCINNITIGKIKVPVGDVIAALESASKAKTRPVQLAKSFAKLPDGITYAEYKTWFESQIEKFDSKAVSENDITKGQEYSKVQKQTAQRLAEALKPKKNISSETRRALNMIRKAIKESPAGLTPDQAKKFYGNVSALFQREDNVKQINALRKKAKRNINRGKLGAVIPFNAEELLRINPHSLSDAQFMKYKPIMERLGADEAELSLPKGLQTKISNLLDDVGSHNLDPVKEQSAPTDKELTPEQEKEKEAYVEQISASKLDPSAVEDRRSRDVLQSLIKPKKDDLAKLSLSALRNMSKGIENANNGFGVSHELFKGITELNSIVEQRNITPAIEKAKPSGLYQKFLGRGLSLLKGHKNYMLEIFRNNPLSHIDHYLGNKGRAVNEGVFAKVGKSFDKFQAATEELQAQAQIAENALQKEHKGNRKKIVKSKFKIYIAQLVREYESNKGKQGIVNPHADVVRTMESANGTRTYYGPKEGAIIKELLDTFSDGERFDLNKLMDSMSPSEKKVLETTDAMYKKAAGPAAFAVRTIHGKESPIYENYVYKNRVNQDGTSTQDIDADAFTKGNASFIQNMISVKSGSVEARANANSSLKMDPIDNAFRATRNILMDSEMSPVIRETRRTTKALSDKFRSEQPGSLSAMTAEAIDGALDEGLKNVFNAATQIPTFADKLINKAISNGYRMVLASAPRAVAELGTNAGFALISAPKEFSLGLSNYAGISRDNTSIDIMLNSGSTVASKLFDETSQSGKFAESDITTGKLDVDDRVGNNRIAEIFSRVTRATGVEQSVTALGKFADRLISTPDQMIGRPLWFGSMARKFQEVTGKEIDFDRIKANDEAYINKNKEAIDTARAFADEQATFAGAATNPFQTVLSLQQTQANKSIIRTMNSYMGRFMFFEQATFMKALNAAMGRGEISQARGMALLVATLGRMATYNAARLALISLMFGADEDEEDLDNMLTQDLVGSLASLLITRNMLNLPKIPANWAIEKVNEDYLDFLRDGEKYDPYKNSIVFSQLGEKDFGYGKSFTDFAGKLSGKYGPALKSANKAWGKAGEWQKAKGKKKEKLAREFLSTVSFEVAGITGLLPLYRDISLYLKRQEKNKKKKGSN